jgi:chromosome segregation ATPase
MIHRSELEYLRDENRRLYIEKQALESNLTRVQQESHKYMMSAASLQFDLMMIQHQKPQLTPEPQYDEERPKKKRKRGNLDDQTINGDLTNTFGNDTAPCQLAQYERHLEDNRREIEEKRQLLDKLEERNKKLITTTHFLESRIQSLEKQIVEQELKNEHLQQLLDSAKQSENSQRRDISERDQQILALRCELKHLNDLYSTNTSHEEEISRLQAATSQIEAESKQKIAELIQANLQLQNIQTEIENKARLEIQELKSIIAQHLEELASADMRFTLYRQQSDAKLNLLESENTSCHSNINDLEALVKKLRDTNEQGLSRFQNERNDLVTKISEIQGKLELESSLVKETLQQLSNTREELLNLNAKKDAEIDLVKREANILVHGLQKQIESMQATLAEERKKYELSSVESQNLQSKADKLEDHLSRLQTELDEIRSISAKQQREHQDESDQLNQEINRLHNEIESLKEQLDFAALKLSAANERNLSLTSDLEQTQSQLEQAQLKILETEEKDQKQAEERISHLEIKYHGQINDLKEELNRTTTLAKEQEEKLETFKINTENVQKEINELEQRIEELITSQQEAKDSSNKMIKKLQDEKDEINNNLVSTQTELKQVQEAKLSLETEINNLKEQISSLQGRVDKYVEEEATLKAELSKARTKEEDKQNNEDNASMDESNTRHQKKCKNVSSQEETNSNGVKSPKKTSIGKRKRKEEDKEQEEQDEEDQPKVIIEIDNEDEEEQKLEQGIGDSNKKNVAPMSPPKKRSRKSLSQQQNKVIIAFSGFKDTVPGYTIKDKTELTQIIKRLHGEVRDDNKHKEDFDPSTTHVVAPPAVRTLKTLGAAVQTKWVLTADWLRECDKQNQFIDERPYGFKGDEKPFEGKSVYMSDQFKKENSVTTKGSKIKYCEKLVVEFGEGSLTDDKDKASYWIIGDNEKIKNLPPSVEQALNWNDLIDFLYPKNRKENITQGESSNTKETSEDEASLSQPTSSQPQRRRKKL